MELNLPLGSRINYAIALAQKWQNDRIKQLSIYIFKKVYE